MQIASFPDVGSTVWGKQNRSVLVIYRDPTARSILKQLLDRLGVFKDYEDRFLDLFRHEE